MLVNRVDLKLPSHHCCYRNHPAGIKPVIQWSLELVVYKLITWKHNMLVNRVKNTAIPPRP